MKQKLLTTILILFTCSSICSNAQGLQDRIKLQDAGAISSKANGGSVESVGMEMMSDPMINSMMQSGMNALQNGMAGTFQQMEQAKQQADFAKQQADYAQQMQKEDDE